MYVFMNRQFKQATAVKSDKQTHDKDSSTDLLFTAFLLMRAWTKRTQNICSTSPGDTSNKTQSSHSVHQCDTVAPQCASTPAITEQAPQSSTGSSYLTWSAADEIQHHGQRPAKLHSENFVTFSQTHCYTNTVQVQLECEKSWFMKAWKLYARA